MLESLAPIVKEVGEVAVDAAKKKAVEMIADAAGKAAETAIESAQQEVKKLPEKIGKRSEAELLPDKIGKRSEAELLPNKIGRSLQDMQKEETSGDAKSEKSSDAPQTSEKSEKEKDVTEVKRMEPPVIVKFKCPDDMDQKEFERQLKGQERGLNSMTVDRWIENRENYKENGRAPEGTEAQKEQRQKALQSRIETNQKNGMSYSDAKAEAEKWIEGQAALHNPDQIAGGDPEKVSRMGDAKVNSSIGGQWKSRVDGLESAIKDYAKDKSPEELANTKLNVKLEMEV